MDIAELAAIRRDNLRRYMDSQLGGNQSKLARVYRPDEPRPNFFSDLFRGKKNFGEKLAGELEDCLGLESGQLSIPSSPLKRRSINKERIAATLRAELADLDVDEQQEALQAIAEIRRRRSRQKRA